MPFPWPGPKDLLSQFSLRHTLFFTWQSYPYLFLMRGRKARRVRHRRPRPRLRQTDDLLLIFFALVLGGRRHLLGGRLLRRSRRLRGRLLAILRSAASASAVSLTLRRVTSPPRGGTCAAFRFFQIYNRTLSCRHIMYQIYKIERSYRYIMYHSAQCEQDKEKEVPAPPAHHKKTRPPTWHALCRRGCARASEW